MAWSKKRLVFTVFGVLTVVVLVYQWWAGAPAIAPVQRVDVRAGSYAALTPAQRRLVDDWTERLGQATGQAS